MVLSGEYVATNYSPGDQLIRILVPYLQMILMALKIGHWKSRYTWYTFMLNLRKGSNCSTRRVEEVYRGGIYKMYIFTGWWFQPIWNILYSQNENLPQIGMKITNVWNHHPDIYWSVYNFLGRSVQGRSQLLWVFMQSSTQIPEGLAEVPRKGEEYWNTPGLVKTGEKHWWEEQKGGVRYFWRMDLSKWKNISPTWISLK